MKSNVQTVDAFVETLLLNPEMTMTAVALRLSTSRYELKLLKADPFLEFDQKHPDPYQLPFVEERNVETMV